MARERDDREKARDRAELQPRWDNVFHWSRACSVVLALPALRAFYPMSSIVGGPTIPPGGNCNDISGNGLTLTYNGNPVYSYSNLIPYIEFDGVGDYLIRADTGANDPFDLTGTETYITPAMQGWTMGGWFQFDALATAITLIGKWDTTANNRSYLLQRRGTQTIRMSSSQNGIVAAAIVDTIGTVDTTTDWWFCGGRFKPSSFITAFLNSEIVDTPTASISTFNSTAAFEISGFQAGTLQLIDGKASLVWVCAAALSDAQIQAVYEQQKALFGVKL